ncbi:hypothetical protein [Nostoc sp. 106C]|uniref:hypothetical protein n=1 Tax=Nostoc sp. 106C TaxID=1932667 RepID=UPI000A3623B7|nr:hypothetical protein [Nostoc sp. 106C]OUL21091.1 hypothetical protein BV378_27960 [Nostoc sp. RF31YmG]OUL28247.1 hypothetical protein BV375_18750 [Nostoc sp. 106C]
MSNITSTSAILAQEQLFTELTPEEGSDIQGGAKFELIGIDVEKAASQYNLYINFNSKRLFGVKTVYRGYYEVGTSEDFDVAGRLMVWDKDYGWHKDDVLASQAIFNTPGEHHLDVQGDGYKYRLDYRIT